MAISPSNEKFQTLPVYDSAQRGFAPLIELREIWRYRDLVTQLVQRDIAVRYKRSFLGVAWTMLNPLGMMVILSVVFSQIFHTIERYPAYVLTGLIAWTFFSQSTSAAINAMVWGGDFFRRIYVPRSIFAIAAIGTGLVNLLFALVPLVLVILVTGVPLRWTILFIPIPMLLLVCFALAVGMLLSTLGIYFPDIVEMYQIILLAWFYFTPILYPVDILPAEIQKWVKLNPMYPIIEMFRQPIYEGKLPTIETFLLSSGVCLFSLLIAFWIFVQKSNDFAYRT